MRFIARESCQDSLPIMDMATFTVRYYGQDDYSHLCHIVENDSNLPMQVYENSSGIMTRYLPKYEIYFQKYSEKSYGWGKIYFNPTRHKLAKLQKWIEKWLMGDFTQLAQRVHLSRIELAYDFFCPTQNDPIICAGIAKRLFFRLWPIGGQNLFATFFTNNLEWANLDADFDKVIAQHGKCADNAINGDFTGYVQSCQRRRKAYSAHSLDPNTRASRHTKIYPKKIDGTWRVRVELTLAKQAVKRIIPFNPANFAGLLDCLPDMPFSRFYEFREVDFATFTRKLAQIPEAGEILSSYTWQKRMNEAQFMPVVDKIRLMRVIAQQIGKKRLYNAILPDFTRKISFSQAIGRRLNPDAEPSRRTRKGENPDNLPFRESLRVLVHIGPEIHELRPVSRQEMQDNPDLPISHTCADMAQNTPNLVLTGEIDKIPMIHTRRPDNVPSAARRTRAGP